MPKFQQRHFEDIAQLLQDNVPKTGTSESREEYRQRLVDAFCTLFSRDNVKFNPSRFRLACMPGNNVRGNRRVGPAMPFVPPRS